MDRKDGEFRFAARLFLCLALLLAAKAAVARDVTPDDAFVPEDLVQEVSAKSEIEEDHGWDFYLRTGLTGSFASSSNVIGATDGNTLTFGGSLHHGVYYTTRLHEWRNDTHTKQAFARTPIIDGWIKSSDEVDYLSMYLYRLPTLRWLGPFGRFRVKTQLFYGTDVRPEEVSYLISRADGTEDTVTDDRLRLTDPFSPLTLRQTLGAFLGPETPPSARFEALLGFGARQTFADGQLGVTDDGATPTIEVTELESFNQAGTEVALSFRGELDDGRISYSAVAEMMTPFINDLGDDDDRSAFELTNLELRATISIRPYDWLSIDYQFRALREPQLLDQLQISNRLLVGISYTLIERGIDAN